MSLGEQPSAKPHGRWSAQDEFLDAPSRTYIAYYGYIRPTAGWLWRYVIRPTLVLVAVLGWSPFAAYMFARANGQDASHLLQSTYMLSSAIAVLILITIVLVFVSIVVGIYFTLKQIPRGLKAIAEFCRQRAA